MTNKIIPTKINRVNLNSFVKPMKESLNIIDLQLQSLSENNMNVVNFKELELVKNANDVKASLKISNAYAETRVVKRYCRLLEVIEKGNFQKQSDFKEAVSIALTVNYQLMTHISKISENPSYSAAHLWKSWSKLGIYFVEDYININELFSPCGNFSDIRFSKAKKVDIEKLINGVIAEYKNAVLDYETTSLKDKAYQALNKILNTLGILLNIRSSQSYHEYWTALRARIQMALNDPNYELDNKKDITEVIKASEIALVNFSAGSTKLNHHLLENVCLGLLTDSARSMSTTDAIINEFYQRFYINEYIEEAERIVLDNEAEKNIESDNIFNKNIKDIKMDLLEISKCWKDNENNMQEKKMLLIYLYNFIDKKSLARFGSNKLNSNELKLLLKNYFDIYGYFFKQKKITDVIPHALSLEYAGLYLLTDYYLKRKGNVEEGFLDMVILCSDRLEAVLNKDFEKLETLPKLEWKGEVKKSLDSELKIEIMQELKKNLNKIKRSYKDFSSIEVSEEDLFDNYSSVNKNNRNTKEIKEALKNIVEYGKDLSFSSPLLQIIGFEHAANIVKAICFMINSLGANGTSLPSKESAEIFSLSLAAFEVFLDDVIDGSDNPEEMLEHAFKRLYKDDNFSIDKKVDDFKLKPLKEEVQEEVEEQEDLHLIANEEPIISEKEDVLPKFNEFRNSENFSTEEPKLQVKMEVKQESEQNKENEQKLKEAKKKKEELTPRFISYDPDDEDFCVDDYIEEILDSEVDANFHKSIEILREDSRNIDAFKDIRRMFHSWKGSGKQVNMYSMGYIGEELNLLFDKRMDMDVEWNPKLENVSIITYNHFRNWALKLSENHEVYFDPTEIFAALKEEEEFYQANYAKDKKLILETELKDNVEFSLPTDEEIKNLSDIKDESNKLNEDEKNINDSHSDIQEEAKKDEENEKTYLNTSYENENESFENKHVSSEVKEETKPSVEDTIVIQTSIIEDEESKVKLSTETISIDSIAEISAGFVSEEEDDLMVVENDKNARNVFDNVIENKGKTSETASFEDEDKDNIIVVQEKDNSSIEEEVKESSVVEVKEEETVVIPVVETKEENGSFEIKAEVEDTNLAPEIFKVNDNEFDKSNDINKEEEKPKGDLFDDNNQKSEEFGDHNVTIKGAEEEEKEYFFEDFKDKLNEEVDLINQNLMVSESFSEFMNESVDSGFVPENHKKALELISSIFVDLKEVDLTDEYADEINELLIFVANNISDEYCDIETSVRELEDKIFEKQESDNTESLEEDIVFKVEEVKTEETTNTEIENKPKVEESQFVNPIKNEEEVGLIINEDKLDLILERLISMKKELNSIKEILTDIN